MPSPTTKRLLREVPLMERDEAFERMRALSDELFAGPDAAEGMAAFAEKRPPTWHLTAVLSGLEHVRDRS